MMQEVHGAQDGTLRSYPGSMMRAAAHHLLKLTWTQMVRCLEMGLMTHLMSPSPQMVLHSLTMDPLQLTRARLYFSTQAPCVAFPCTTLVSKNTAIFPSKSLSATNESDFIAAGRGNMCIKVPNGMVSLRLYLTEVLFSPKVGYTLVSIR